MADPFIDQARPSRGVRLLLVLALAFVAGVVLMAAAVMRWPAARNYLLGPQQVAAVQPTALPVQPPATPAQVVDTRVADLESRLDRIDLRAVSAAGNADRAESLLVAFAARRALDRGVGLGYVEAQLRDRFAGTQPQAVGAVLAASQTPVTIASLRQGLEALAPTLLNPAAERDWWQATRHTVGSLFVVRRASTPSPAPDERLRRARLLLEGGQVDRAMTEVARFPRSAGTEAWLAAARRYVEAHRALDIIEADALTRPVSAPLGPVLSPTPTQPEPQ